MPHVETTSAKLRFEKCGYGYPVIEGGDIRDGADARAQEVRLRIPTKNEARLT